jgi:hypothetical protein
MGATSKFYSSTVKKNVLGGPQSKPLVRSLSK